MNDTRSTLTPADAPPGLLDPLKHGNFALLAGATLISNVGVWMRDTTSAWTVATIAEHHSSVALVQAATALPTLLLALPAGVLADHFDRRRILILCQLVLAAAGGTLAVLSAWHLLTVGAIISIALVAGSAAALAAPAFQAIVPSLVPREDVRPAVALASVSFNIARVIGPAAGGVLLAAVGPAAAYACNVMGYIATILALLLVSRTASQVPTPAPIVFRAELHQGFAFVGHSSEFRRVLARGMALYVCASCYLALTPLIAHDVLGKNPGIYGTLLGAVGIGSIFGGWVLSQAKRKLVTDDTLLFWSAITGAVALGALSLADEPILASLSLALAGAGTLIQLATLNAAAQLLLPETIRGRGLSVYMAATFGCMAAGSLLWGSISDTFSIQTALMIGALAFAATAIAGRYAHIDATVRSQPTSAEQPS